VPPWTDVQGLELQTGSFTLKQIKAATNDFDSANKVGEGGFGPVFKVMRQTRLDLSHLSMDFCSDLNKCWVQLCRVNYLMVLS
jgi:hypothetical protein